MDDVRMTLPPNLEKAVEYRINGERLPRLLLLWVVGIATLALFALTVVLYAAINSGWYWHPRYYPRRYATPLSAFAFAGAVFLVLSFRWRKVLFAKDSDHRYLKEGRYTLHTVVVKSKHDYSDGREDLIRDKEGLAWECVLPEDFRKVGFDDPMIGIMLGNGRRFVLLDTPHPDVDDPPEWG
ncbi:MAG: hypothetical protein IKI21_09220 [Oscillospiraceae bacterium]|nr:hypothetical protein [Oscillospiraceae bacterium]